MSNSNEKLNSVLIHELSEFPFYTDQKGIFSEGKKNGTRGGNELIEIRKIRSIVLHHETPI